MGGSLACWRNRQAVKWLARGLVGRPCSAFQPQEGAWALKMAGAPEVAAQCSDGASCAAWLWCGEWLRECSNSHVVSDSLRPHGL